MSELINLGRKVELLDGDDLRKKLDPEIGFSPEDRAIHIRRVAYVSDNRDPKGLYKRALAGEIPNMTGIGDPYEEPPNPEVVVDTEKNTAEENAEIVLAKLRELCHI